MHQIESSLVGNLIKAQHKHMTESLLGKRDRNGELIAKDKLTPPDTTEENTTPMKSQTKQQSSLSGFIKGAGGKSKLATKGAWHKDSLWRDLSITPTMLENGEKIFDIIMPWVEEQNNDQKKETTTKVAKKDNNQQSIASFMTVKPKTSEKQVGKKEKIDAKATKKEESKSVAKPEDTILPEVQLKLLSKVLRMPDVESFEWRYKPNIL